MSGLGCWVRGVGWLVLAAGAVWAQGRAPKAQPIPFSHKVHVGLGVKCADCHTLPAPGDLATYPKEDQCMACHAAIQSDSPSIRKLAEFHRERKPVPWVRIYKVAEYVVFSHQSHYRQAKISCETCHGPVAARDVITLEKPPTMKACMDCHDERGASNECNFCHQPF